MGKIPRQRTGSSPGWPDRGGHWTGGRVKPSKTTGSGCMIAVAGLAIAAAVVGEYAYVWAAIHG